METDKLHSFLHRTRLALGAQFSEFDGQNVRKSTCFTFSKPATNTFALEND